MWLGRIATLQGKDERNLETVTEKGAGVDIISSHKLKILNVREHLLHTRCAPSMKCSHSPLP